MQLVLMEDQALGKLPPAAQCWVGPKGLEFVDHRTLGPLVVLVLAYLSYLTAETFHMSGILAITFCGITMKNYVEQVSSGLFGHTLKILSLKHGQNISESSSVTIRSSAHMFANIAELMIFLFLGVFTVTGQDSNGESIHE